jgi:hypothetical protein
VSLPGVLGGAVELPGVLKGLGPEIREFDFNQELLANFDNFSSQSIILYQYSDISV